LGYLKIKEAADTLGIVCFFLQYETFWMVCLGQGWYPKGMHKNAWYLKGFLAHCVVDGLRNQLWLTNHL